MKSNLLKQHNVGLMIGRIKDVVIRTNSYGGMVSYFMIFVMAYHTTLRDTLLVWFPWLSFQVYLLVLGIGYLLLMVLEYKFGTPSSIAYFNQQLWEHDSPTKQELKEIKERLSAIEKGQKNKGKITVEDE